MPVFLPGFGAYVRWQSLGVSLETRRRKLGRSLLWLAAVLCAVLWAKTGDASGQPWPVGAWLNVMNLIPIWVLDGGQAAQR